MSRTQILFKTLALFFLYFAQGMPVGFIYVALPVFLRQQGVTLTLIGLANILALPWSVKFLWAPLIDKFGRRKKNWIIVMQFGMTAAVLALMQVNPASHLHLFFFLVFALNFTAATQDIAVDGLAVRILKDRETGWGNSAQVGGYRLGMLVGGGVLIYVSAALTWSGVFALMAAIILALMIIPVFIPEDDWNRAAAAPSLPSRKILSRLRSHLASTGGLALLLFVVGYKFGQALGGSMVKVMLVDRGLTEQQIGLIVGLYGSLATLLGAVLGGALKNRLGIRALVYFSLLQGTLLLLFGWYAGERITYHGVLLINSLEHLAGGMVTAAFFAWLMDLSDPEIGASEFTCFMCLMTAGVGAGITLGGFVADRFGYQPLFYLGGLLVVPPLLLLPRIVKTRPRF